MDCFILIQKLITNHTSLFFDSQKENSAPHTERQMSRAKLSRNLCQMLGCPSMKDHKSVIQANAIVNCPVKVEDIAIAKKIFGPDICHIIHLNL